MRTFILDVNQEGKLDWSPTQKAIWHDWKLDRYGKKISLKVEDYRGTKSQQQLGYWFGALVPAFAEFHKISLDDAEDLMKVEFNAKYIKVGDRAVKVGGSLAKNTHVQMEQAIERAIRYFEENGIPVPDPEDYKRDWEKAPLK